MRTEAKYLKPRKNENIFLSPKVFLKNIGNGRRTYCVNLY